MIDKNKHIDELLKQSFEQFQPEAPDVWDAVSNQVNQINLNGADQIAQATQVTSSTFSITAKIAVAIASAAAIGTVVYFAYTTSTVNEQSPNETQISNNHIDETVVSQEPITEQTEVENTGQTKAISSKKSVTKPTTPVSKEDSKSANPKIDEHHTNNSNITTLHHTTAQSSSPDQTSSIKNTSNYAAPIPNKEEVLSKLKAPNKSTESQHETDTKFDIPHNVITPNGDGKNDEFVVNVPDVEMFFIRIVNRKGQTVFETENHELYWNGKWMQSGEDCEPGEYFYTLKFSTKSQQEQTQNGKIVIIR